MAFGSADVILNGDFDLGKLCLGKLYKALFPYKGDFTVKKISIMSLNIDTALLHPVCIEINSFQNDTSTRHGSRVN